MLLRNNRLQISLPYSLRETFDVHAPNIDRNFAYMHSEHDFFQFADPGMKGGIWPDALPNEVIEEIAGLAPSKIEKLHEDSVPIVNIDKKTGETQFPLIFKRTLSRDTLNYIDSVSQKFNGLGSWDAGFCIVARLPARPSTTYFHIETKHADVERTHLITAAISQSRTERDHETEILMTDGLEIEDVRALMSYNGDHKDLPRHVQDALLISKTGDLIFNKGLGDGVSDIMTGALVHRAPPHKRDLYDRYTLTWRRILHPVLDLD